MRFELRPSPRLAALVLALHAAAGASLYAVTGGGAGLLLAILAGALGAATAWDRALLRAGASPRAIELEEGSGARVATADGQSLPAAPGTWRANRYWVSIPLEAPRRRSLLVTADMLEGRDFRHLRLWALWRRLPGVAPGQLSG